MYNAVDLINIFFRRPNCFHVSQFRSTHHFVFTKKRKLRERKNSANASFTTQAHSAAVRTETPAIKFEKLLKTHLISL